MKKLSVKMKITLWFAIFMVILCVVILLFVGRLSSQTSASESQQALTEFTEENLNEIEYDEGVLDIDDDFRTFYDGMYCMVFTADGSLIAGGSPYEALNSELSAISFEDGKLHTVTAGNENFWVYDRLAYSYSRAQHNHDSDAGNGSHGEAVTEAVIWVRSIVPEGGGAAVSMSVVYRTLPVALPLLIILAVVGGYMLAGRCLRPIRKISETAEEIGASGDLSKRIELPYGSGEFQRLAEVFNDMFERLEQNFEAERQFTSDASHELRTPVANILAQCEYAFENAESQDDLYEALSVIQKQGYRMKRLIEQLLQFTRIEQNTENFEMLPLDFSGLVQAVCEEHSEPGIKGIVLKEKIQPDIMITGNETLLMRLVENLVRNAYRYGREGGWVMVELSEKNGHTVLSVADNGIGITAEELPKIWTRFYRVDKARSDSGVQGLGLGLSMVKQIAELHGGVVSVESISGAGSRFFVKF